MMPQALELVRPGEGIQRLGYIGRIISPHNPKLLPAAGLLEVEHRNPASTQTWSDSTNPCVIVAEPSTCQTV